MNKIVLRIMGFIIPLALLCGSADETFVLEKVFNPQKLCVFEDKMIIVDGFEFHLFSLEEMKRMSFFGREGNGPGDLQANPYWYNSAAFSGDEIFVDSVNKIIYFSQDGKYLRQKNKPAGIHQMHPVGQNFLGLNQTHMEGDIQYVVLLLFDPDMKQIIELARQQSPVQSVMRTTEAIYDTLNYAVMGGDIYVEKSREGFLIDVFNSKGAKIREIKKEIPLIPILKRDKEAAIERIKSDPTIKNLLGFERLKTMTEFIYPDAYPAVTGIFADKHRLYVLTSELKNGETECLVLDPQGKELERVYVPIVNPAPFVSQLLGIQFFTLSDKKFYYADVEEDKTVLHIKNIY